jgi:hypothetical protein
MKFGPLDACKLVVDEGVIMKLQATTLFLIASIGMAIGVRAQGTGGGITESTDPAKAAAVERAVRDLQARQAQQAKSGSPQSSAFVVRGQTEAGFPYLSGGISVDDRTTMYAERGRYTLWVATVARPSGAYLTDARLQIVDLKGRKVVVDRTMDGPWFFVALPAGRYEITATVPPDGPDAAQTLSAQVNVPQSGQRQAVLRFASSAEVGPEMVSPFGGNPFGSPPVTK